MSFARHIQSSLYQAQRANHDKSLTVGYSTKSHVDTPRSRKQLFLFFFVQLITTNLVPYLQHHPQGT